LSNAPLKLSGTFELGGQEHFRQLELEGVIAHELGHIVARHSTIDMTMLFREVLGATQVTDRKDIFDKYNQLIENTDRLRELIAAANAALDRLVMLR